MRRLKKWEGLNGGAENSFLWAEMNRLTQHFAQNWHFGRKEVDKGEINLHFLELCLFPGSPAEQWISIHLLTASEE